MSKKFKTSQLGVQMRLHDYYHEQINKQDGTEFKFDEEKADRSLAMLITHMEVKPKSFVSRHFQGFITLVNPQFQVTFDSIERHCLDIYKEEKMRVKQLLENLDGLISLSVDVMRHDGTELLFVMCLRAHFIDADWNLKNWVISYFSPSLSNDKNFCETYINALLDFNICNKISTITLGNVPDNETVPEFIRDRTERKVQLNELIFRVHCCADTFRDMVEYPFDNLRYEISDVQLLVSSRNSPPMWSIIIGDLQRAVELESKGEYTKTDEYYYVNIPTESEWEKIKVVTKLVGFIYNAAEPLFEMKNPTASLYLHNIWELKINLSKETTSADKFMKETALRMLKTLNKYWEDMSLFLAVATVIDPRCKMNFIEFFSCKNKDIDGKLQAAQVLETIEGIFNSYKASELEADSAGKDLPMPDADADNSESEDYYRLPKEIEERRSNPSFGFSCLNEYNQFVESKSQSPKSELELYLEAPVVSWDKDFDVLSWWKSASPKYPTLAKIARDLLAIPLTLATHEDAYFLEFRSPDLGLISLNPELMNALKCTRSWNQVSNTKED